MAMGHVYGPLMPIDSDKVFIQCGWEKHYWIENPLYIFDDTLIHRSVNDYKARRHAVFMDIMRPRRFPGCSPSPGVSVIVVRINTRFYKNWFGLAPKAARLQRPVPRRPDRPRSTECGVRRSQAASSVKRGRSNTTLGLRSGELARRRGGTCPWRFPARSRVLRLLINPFRSMHEI